MGLCMCFIHSPAEFYRNIHVRGPAWVCVCLCFIQSPAGLYRNIYVRGLAWLSTLQEETVNQLVAHWNQGLEKTKQLVQEQNEALHQRHAAGQLSAPALAKALQPIPQELKPPGSKWARSFIRNFGWSLLSGNSEQASLPMNHPDMQLFRDYYETMVTKDGIHKWLVLNFDQLWRCAYSCSGKMAWKPRGNVTKRGRKVKAPKTLDKKRHAIRNARKSLTVPSMKWTFSNLPTNKYLSYQHLC